MKITGNFNGCPYGLYKVWWKTGGWSYASIGGLHNGDRWIAPTNWTSTDNPTGKVKDQPIKKMKLLHRR